MTKLRRLASGEQFAYLFDFGDHWAHLCTVAAQRIDPLDELGIMPTQPLPYFGWATCPTSTGGRWDADDGEFAEPERPSSLLVDLRPILPWWGPRQRG